MTRHNPADPGMALAPAKESGGKPEKVRIYQIAKEYSVSSEAMLKIVRGLGAEAKSHMSSIDADIAKKVEQEFNKEKEAVKEDFARKRAVDRASRKRQQGALASKPAEAATVKADVKAKTPPPAGGGPQARQRGGGGRRPVDQKVVRANIKKTMSEDKGKRRYRKRKEDAVATEEETKILRVTEFISTSELANFLDLSASQIIAKAMELGSMVTINQRLDRDMIEMLADDFGWTVEFESVMEAEVVTEEEDEVREEDLRPRSPVVTIMGHVDHGKTSLLDHIRESNVIAGESGGITQHIGAYHVELPKGVITFLDTPGHEAFTAMRARGAQITDIVILVVAADDSVMPQTIEAIDHAKDAEVPIIVAINKIDRPGANPEQVRQQLTAHGITPEAWGGEHMVVDVSAKTGQGVPELLEAVLLQAEVMELRADPNRPAKGVIIESRKERGRGTVVTALVQEGQLKVGDAIVAGSESGRVRALTNERGQRIESAGPSTPCGVLGFSDVPAAGETFRVMKDERAAREVGARRAQLMREQEHRYHRHTTLENLFEQIQGGETAELRVVIKADVEGSMGAVADSLQKMATDEVEMRVVHRGVGAINESDVLLAAASDAIVLGFHVTMDPVAEQTVKREGVDVRTYEIIYEMVEDVRAAMEGLLKPDIERRTLGQAEVRAIFRVPKLGTIAGSMVVSGLIKRNAGVLVKRAGKTVHEGKIGSLRRFKDDVSEVKSGFECGIGVENFPGVREGDVLEVFEDVEVARRL
ncbi:MAG: translation initiation factor IF-2 [Gemmatimonadota bacterium]|nr:MAG: translation initiation factor IF-2 [Gemmatimonadota bacterium]